MFYEDCWDAQYLLFLKKLVWFYVSILRTVITLFFCKVSTVELISPYTLSLTTRLKGKRTIQVVLLIASRLSRSYKLYLVMYGCERWTIKKAEHWRIDAFQLWCWRRLLRVPWTARRSNQSILKISPEYSLEGLRLKLKLQYFGHLMKRTDSLEKTLMLGKLEAGGDGDDRGWDGWIASPTQWTWVWANSGSWWWTGKPGVLQSMGLQRVGHDWASELNWKL